LWDAPVYAQFFRSVRAVNALRPAKQRLQVGQESPAASDGWGIAMRSAPG
jgi:hypothetical protein